MSEKRKSLFGDVEAVQEARRRDRTICRVFEWPVSLVVERDGEGRVNVTALGWFADGRCEIAVLRPKADTTIRDNFLTRAKGFATNSVADRMAGYAVVTWTRDGLVCVGFENGDLSPVVSGGVPQFVKDVLVAETAVKWARDD